MGKRLDAFIGYFLAFLMALMFLSVTWQVATRYLFEIASTFTEELARYLLIWVGTLGAAFISGKNMHLAIDLLPSRLEGRRKHILVIVIKLLIVVFALFAMVIGGSRLMYVTYTLGQTSAAMQIPLTYVYSILPVSGLLIIYYKLRDIYHLQYKTSRQPESSQP